MRRSMTVLVVLGVIVVALVVWKGGGSAQTCPTRVVLHGHSYTPASTTEEVISGNDLGDGTERGCGWKGSYERRIAMNKIPGIDPKIAVASPVAAYIVFLAPGVTPQDLPEKFGTVTVHDPS